ncbi:unknown protein [Seminavis robusta]|uniref:Uncharacterized protein n=1 Tax=Seminavis robusta TaxID=568900 RepID=A0A9N8F199_9STRA|nr:unknown protein [Seminavis robusta]|eukprot:Sro2988_g341720.1 n/a (706) ;mRNA; r:1006-3472
MRIDETVKAILFHDIESNQDASCDDLVRDIRPELYADLVSPIRNRFHYLKRLKKNNPLEYIDQAAKARKIYKNIPDGQWTKQLPKDATEDAAITVPAPTESSSKQAEDPPYSPSNLESTWTSPRRATRSSTKKAAVTPTDPPPAAPIPVTSASTPSIVEPEPSVTPGLPPRPPSNKKKNKMTGTPKKSNATKATTTPSRKIRIFADINEAKESVDHPIDVDTDFPESHGHGIFVLEIPDAIQSNTSFGTYVSDEIKFVLEHLVDITDYNKIDAQLVLNGTALLINKPSVSSFFIHKYLKLLSLEAEHCQRTEDEFKFWLTAVTQDESRQVQSLLFVFPEGTVCTTDFASAEPSAPKSDMPVKLLLRELDTVIDIEGSQIQQIFYPGYFRLRVIPETSKMADAIEAPAKSLASAFEGMCHITNQTSQPSPRPQPPIPQPPIPQLSIGLPQAVVSNSLSIIAPPQVVASNSLSIAAVQSNAMVASSGLCLADRLAAAAVAQKAKSKSLTVRGRSLFGPSGQPPALVLPKEEPKPRGPRTLNLSDLPTYPAAPGGNSNMEVDDVFSTPASTPTVLPQFQANLNHDPNAAEQKRIYADRKKDGFKPTLDNGLLSDARIEQRKSKSSLKRQVALDRRRKKAELQARLAEARIAQEQQEQEQQDLTSASSSEDSLGTIATTDTLSHITQIEGDLKTEVEDGFKKIYTGDYN